MNDQMGLSELYKAYMFDPCFSKLRERFNFVPGVGTSGNIMFIGEAPGKEEDRLREPFIGVSGQILREMLEEIDIRYDDCFVTNVLKYRPDKFNRDPSPGEIRDSLPYLSEEISTVNPYLIVLLGKIPAQSFYPGKLFKMIRGQLFDRRGRKVLVTWHPAATIYQPEMLPEYRKDFLKIKEVVDGHTGSKVDS